MRCAARLVGTDDRALHGLLADLLAEHDVDLRDEERADVVLALVCRDDVRRVVADANRLGAPVIAIVGYLDELLVASVRGAGVERIHSLEAPLENLCELIRCTLEGTKRVPPRRSPRDRPPR